MDDQESIHAIQRAVELGVTFFDTAANYGAGHSERILGRALGGHRSSVVIATKFGYRVLDDQKLVDGLEVHPEAIRRSCEASLRRLGTEYIDLFQFHVGGHPADQVDDVLDTLESLVAEGHIRAYGWSTDDPVRARAFAAGKHCAAIQHQLNIFEDNPEMLTPAGAEPTPREASPPPEAATRAEAGSLSAAAHALGVVTSTVGRRMTALERRLGSLVFQRMSV
ncbi:putative aldo/keto reductase [Cystobacter fuscus DSM 2262]|uniref:Aldo/keto reductase n=1 Tax=Cystobacter fuscus (strain ATCC 25194 / DSM 2262 / NBRC 100088 / M29) TaxID=1242864 RepID=S9NWE5_CYSF2|nr:putative aldo/keto reductase [Cystobacter fuscus DSM 2262]